jgi:hypothetical protein
MPSPKSAKTSVIKFPAKSSCAARRSRVGKRPDHPDADLIEHCIEYAMQITGALTSYKIDPTDAEFAAFFDNVAQSRADRALRSALDLPPQTMDGLRAKAAIVRTALDDWSGNLDELRQEFLISLANDVIRFQKASFALKQSCTEIVVPE